MTRSVVRWAGAAIATGSLACGFTQPQPWALTDVTVIDVRGGMALPGRTVVVRGDRIVEVTSLERSLPAGIRTVSGQGRAVLPGLFDMHAHMVGVTPEPLPLDPSRYSSMGVLGLRDLGGPVDSIVAFQGRSASILSPRVWFTGPILDSLPRDFAHLFMQIDSPDQAAEVADLAVQHGWVSMKVSDWLSPSIYSALATAARQRDIPLVGHIPHAVPLEAVVSAGQRSVEHLGGLPHGILRACSRGIPPDRVGLGSSSESGRYAVVMSSDFVSPLVEGFDLERCREVVRQLADNEIWQVPNLTLWRLWAESTPSFVDTPENRTALRSLYRVYAQIVQLMNEEDVKIMTGVDEVPGASVHDEMELLVSAGLSPLEALRAGTINPVDFLGAGDSLGSISEGRLADFLILDGNPLTDIRNTTRIRSIVVGGELFDLIDGELLVR